MVKSMCGLAILMLIVLTGSIQIIAWCKKLGEKCGNSSTTKVVQLYKELQIWIGYCNRKFCYFAVPPMIFFGMCIIILATYVSIRLAGKVPLAVHCFFVVTSAAGFTAVGTILPRAVMVWEGSERLIKFLRGRCDTKFERRLVRPLSRVGIRVGPFETITKEWQGKIVSNIVDGTINLLLTF